MDSLETAMGLTADAGDAKSFAMEAIAKARACQFEAAKDSLERANDALMRAHETQTELIRREMSGDSEAVRLIMVHAQDHLMSAVLIRDMAEEFISLYKLIEGIKK
jgi:PTS system cellobiose-specific IIA component